MLVNVFVIFVVTTVSDIANEIAVVAAVVVAAVFTGISTDVCNVVVSVLTNKDAFNSYFLNVKFGESGRIKNDIFYTF